MKSSTPRYVVSSSCKSIVIAVVVVALQISSVKAEVIEEILVTAQKRVQRVVDVPTSMSAYDNETLRSNMVVGLEDYFQFTPNVAFAQRPSGNRTLITIRGISNIGGNANPLGVYVNEFSIAPGNDPQTFNTNLVDIERVEVLRGPQGTAFGRNVVGGAISITTAKPEDVFSASVNLRKELYQEVLGDYTNDAYLFGHVNLPLNDSLALRFAGSARHDQGWVENVQTGQDNEVDEYSGRMSLRWQPGDQTTVDFMISYTDFEELGRVAIGNGELRGLGVTAAGLPGFLFPGDRIELPVNPGSVATGVGQGFYPDNRNRMAEIFGTTTTETLISTLTVTHSWDDWELTSVTGYLDSERAFLDDGRFEVELLFRDEGGEVRPAESASQELRLAYQGFDKGFLQFGGIVSRDEERYSSAIRWGEDVPRVFPVVPVGALIFDEFDKDETEQWAVFVDGAWDISQNLELGLGARYTRDSVESTAVDRLNDVSAQAEDEFSAVTVRAALTWRLGENQNLYGLYSEGYKTGGLQPFVPAGAPTAFDEEFARNYEIGFKGRLLDNTLFVSVAAFFMEWEDLQVNFLDLDPESPTFFLRFINNAAETHVLGFETDLKWQPVPALSFTAGVGYLDSEFEEFDSCSQTADCTGDRLPRAPKWTVSGSAEYRSDLSTGLEGFVRLEGRWRDELLDFSDVFPIPEANTLGTFRQFNLRAGVDSGTWRAVFYVENLTDEFDPLGVFNIGGTRLSGDEITPMAPRSYGIELGYRF